LVDEIIKYRGLRYQVGVNISRDENRIMRSNATFEKMADENKPVRSDPIISFSMP
jgi:hypothetical protein